MQYFQKLLMANSCLHAKNSSKEKKVMQLLYGSPKFYEKAKLINDPKLMIDMDARGNGQSQCKMRRFLRTEIDMYITYHVGMPDDVYYMYMSAQLA